MSTEKKQKEGVTSTPAKSKAVAKKRETTGGPKKAAPKKAPAKKAAPKKDAPKKAAARKTVARQAAAKKAPARRKAAPSKGLGAVIDKRARYEMIARMAYFRAEKRNFEPGWELEDWLESERMIDRMLESGGE